MRLDFPPFRCGAAAGRAPGGMVERVFLGSEQCEEPVGLPARRVRLTKNDNPIR
jgi:hypothetical protein